MRSIAALIAGALVGCGHAARPPSSSPSSVSAGSPSARAAAAVIAAAPPVTTCIGQPGSTAIDLSPMHSAIKARVMIELHRVPEIADGATSGAPMPSTLTCDELATITSLSLTIEVSTLAGVENLRNLSSLIVPNITDGDLSPLRGLPLTLFELGPATDGGALAIKDFSPIASLVRLETLRIRRGALPDLHLLVPLAELRDLEISDCGVADITGLVGLNRLADVDLRGNAITQVHPLVGLVALENLRLAGNPLADLSPLVALRVLESLDVDDTAVEDLRPMLELPKLLFLLACGTPAVQRDAPKPIRATITALTKHGVAVDQHDDCMVLE